MNAMKTKPRRTNQLWHRIRGAVDGYSAGIVRLIGERYGTQALEQAWREFTLGDGGEFRCHDPHTELFFSYLFHQWSPTPEKDSILDDSTLYGVPPTRAYLDRHSARLNPLLRRYLEACLVSVPSFYEISDCKPTVGFGARDVISGMECHVSEELASVSLKNGAIAFAHLVRMDDKTTLLEAISPLSFPAEDKERLKRLYTSYACGSFQVPELRELYFALVHSALIRSTARMH
jgi:hypothetical protein